MSEGLAAPQHFRCFVAIDWSGAAGERHAGIAVALARRGTDAPQLVFPAGARRWSRDNVAEWLASKLPPDTLVGLDLSIALPFADRGAYFPGWSESPSDARALWALVERRCAADPHLGVTSFVDHPAAALHFRRRGGREGQLFGGGRGRLRETELAQQRMGCRPTSNFNLVGAAQVGKASLSGMRMLHRLEDTMPVWPLDPLPRSGSVLVEIYTAIAALEAGRPPGRTKMRNHADLNTALAAMGSAPVAAGGPIDDHASDALLTAAWLRRAAHRPALWHPHGLDPVRFTEGWTFGAP
ncbi:MAG: hypothetical protein V4579_13535 [Pseudomonadota bacterium]